MAFKSFDTAREAEVQPGDTLEKIAEREQSQGNHVTAADIAKYNWGTDNPEFIQELLRDELGATERNAPHAFVLETRTAERGSLKIPERFRAPGLPADREHRLRVRRRHCPKQFLACSGLPAFSFEFDSSFLRPEAKPHLKPVQQMAEAFPDSRLFVFGHTDAVGDDLYNKKLSERRAWCVFSFLTRDPHAWETLYSHHKENWGVSAIQQILTHLGHDPGAVDGDLGPLTRAAMRSFLGLPDGASVSNNAAFRIQLFEAYMSGPDDPQVPRDRFFGHGFMGCGEFNLTEATDKHSPENRRATVFVFHKDRLPNIPCAFADLGPCRERISENGPRYNPGFSCSFYDTLAEPCAAENEHHSVSLLIKKFPVTSALVNHLMDEYELRSTCGKLGEARKAMSASTRDDTYLELRWEHVREHMVLTLVHKLGDGERVLLSEVPFSQLKVDGNVPLEEAEGDEPGLEQELDDSPDASDDEPNDASDAELDLAKAPWEEEF